MKAAQVSRGVPPALKAAQVAMEYREDLERLRQREAAVSSREAAVAAREREVGVREAALKQQPSAAAHKSGSHAQLDDVESMIAEYEASGGNVPLHLLVGEVAALQQGVSLLHRVEGLQAPSTMY